ncbi:hypothetical protein [Sediminispirochaeta smaragdinae]|uniref:Uncharacterized protein n=1 Tax=Sediminispirochaeta smaragdinae (strain DSM 11293 / JCM 15392 / SEBR 4228) TaxID=573413 RepID=E1R3L2_SEDSS|nr:hypothetical protein [Sediminispirochaeta smaragdinae]ADK81643.1 hypothetical protein Spirs_2530 [Sediminispirochaeta smaragdinae DSM 11293]
MFGNSDDGDDDGGGNPTVIDSPIVGSWVKDDTTTADSAVNEYTADGRLICYSDYAKTTILSSTSYDISGNIMTLSGKYSYTVGFDGENKMKHTNVDDSTYIVTYYRKGYVVFRILVVCMSFCR